MADPPIASDRKKGGSKGIKVSPEAYGDIQDRTQPRAAVDWVLVPHKTEFKSETNAGKQVI